jgi:hypothetical protein
MSTIPTIPAPTEKLEQRFARLADVWLKETAVLSSPERMMAHPAFQEIVSMGEAVIPCILRVMGKSEGYWFLALGEITEEQPFPPAIAGKVELIEQAWFDWARQKGYVW